MQSGSPANDNNGSVAGGFPEGTAGGKRAIPVPGAVTDLARPGKSFFASFS